MLEAYLQRRGDLVRVFASRMRSVSRAEDLVQAMFERLLVVPAQEEIENPVGYLYRLGSNLLLDHVRQGERRRNRERAWSDLQGARIGALRASEEPNPEETAIARQRLTDLLRAVAHLPPQTRRVFTLHKIEGLSHAEAAARLGVSKSAVEKHMSLALRLLSEHSGS